MLRIKNIILSYTRPGLTIIQERPADILLTSLRAPRRVRLLAPVSATGSCSRFNQKLTLERYMRMCIAMCIGVPALTCLLAIGAIAQTPAADSQSPAAAATPAPAAPAPLSNPSITGPISGLPPALFDAGPLG